MAQQSVLVPDEIWREIPTRGLPRSRVFVLVALVTAVALVGAGVAASGLLSPRLRTSSTAWLYKEGSQVFGSQLEVTNEGRFPVTLDRPALSASWLKLTSVNMGAALQDPLRPQFASPAFSVTIEPGDTAEFQVNVKVTDCKAINPTGSDVVFQAKGPLLARTANLQPGYDQYPGAPSSYSYSGEDPWVAHWPVVQAAAACGVPAPKR